MISKIIILEQEVVSTADVYSLLVSFSIGAEFFGFALLLISAVLIEFWQYLIKNKGILLLIIFFTTAGNIGTIRWVNEEK
tara:strand:- start:128 stop:367 length:240 start_codon:yes stop_codon:yes gene_type:complete